MKLNLIKIKGYLINKGQPTRLLCFLTSLLLIVLVFNNVIFRHASLSMIDLTNVTGNERQMNVAHPEISSNNPNSGFSDTGGAAFQSEPMQQFMKDVLYHGQSPFWNPYVATGTLGPETMVDNKFSPFTLLVALFGGSLTVFHLVLLFLYVLAIYCLLRLITVHFKLSFLSALVAAIIYLLCGYSVANLSSNVSQVYLFFPVLLFALCSFASRPSIGRYLILIIANVLVFLITFLPTMILTLLTVYLVAAGFIFNNYPLWKNRLILFILQISSALTAFLLLAFLWFPLFEGAKILKLFEMYNARIFYPANLGAFLSFFTPKFFWESYCTMPLKILYGVADNVIFHFGLIASMIVAIVFVSRKNFQNWVIWILLILLFIFLGRIFAIPGLYQLYGVMPQIKNIGEQYLWIVVAYSFVLLSAFGMESLKADKKYRFPLLAVIAVILGSIFYLNYHVAVKGDYYFENFATIPYYSGIIFYLGMTFMFIIFAVIIFYLINKIPSKILIWKSLLVLLVFSELFYYMNTLRYTRQDIFKNPPAYISFLKANIGNNRLATYSLGFNPDLGAAYQIQQLESLNYVLPWYKKFYERNFQTPHDRWGDFSMVMGQQDEPNIHKNILDLLSVKYILTDNNQNKYKDYFTAKNYPIAFSDGHHFIFENTNAYPRVFAATSIKKAELTPDTQSYSLSDVIFSQDDKLLNLAQKAGITESNVKMKDSQNDVKLISYDNAKIVVKANLQSPAVVAMMDNWHPNWKAYANGQEVYIGKIDESFRGVALGAGEYTIEFRYVPKTLKFALWITGFMVLLLVGMVIFRRRFNAILAHFIKPTKIVNNINHNLNNPSFCIVVPMYNEENNTQKCIETISAYLKKIKSEAVIIAVNDGSQDQTMVILEKIAKKNNKLFVVNHPRNNGYGAANITGAKLALKNGFEYVLFMDADLTQNVAYVKAFMKEMQRGTDYIKATRYSGGGGTRGVPWGRRTVSKVGNILAKVFFRLPLTDYTNGFRAVKTKILSQIKSREKGFSYLIEEVHQVSKIAKTYAEIPYILTARKEKFSKSKFNYSPRVYYNYLKYLFKK